MSSSSQAVRLPNEMYQPVISDLHVGEFAFTVPWAMEVDIDGQCYLNIDFFVRSGMGGTVEMGVLRTAEGFYVFLPEHGRSRSFLYRPQKLSDAEKANPVVGIVRINPRGLWNLNNQIAGGLLRDLKETQTQPRLLN